MARSPVTIEARDGRCEASLFRPSAAPGPWPAVIVYMDGIGIRPALFEIGERIAARGYVVLLPDLFYRAGPYVAPNPRDLFFDMAIRAAWSSKYIASASQANVMAVTAAFLGFFCVHSHVFNPNTGTTRDPPTTLLSLTHPPT